MTPGVQTDVAEKAREARESLRACRLCPRRCGVNRLAGERGYCGLDGRAYWFREMVHYGIELELIPSHAIYFAGCNMRCAFCTAAGWNDRPTEAEPWDAGVMRDTVVRRRREGALWLHFVGGEPTLSLPAALDLLAALADGYPVIWDTNMYLSAEARELLRGVVDVYVADLKFGNDRCAAEVSDAPDYLATVLEGLRFAEESASLIVRHLLLPGHLDCCFRLVVDTLKRELRRPRLALHVDYLPPARASRGRGLARFLTSEEARLALDLAGDSGIELVE